MASTRFHLAQANIGPIRAPLDDPLIEGFTSAFFEDDRTLAKTFRATFPAPERDRPLP